jgi:2-polyprenyl-3-methyl-5-hydroxy-6-metoxy-1,4-benzoquinol methylase
MKFMAKSHTIVPYICQQGKRRNIDKLRRNDKAKDTTANFNDMEKKWFDRILLSGMNTVSNYGLGNYSTNYNTWKRIAGIRDLFRQEIEEKAGSLRVLDVGCGDALPLYILNSFKYENVRFSFNGVDISSLDIYFAKRLKLMLKAYNFTFAMGKAEDLPYQKSTFDIVICSEVLEHLVCPEDCIKEIRRVLKDDGVAFISTPNESNFIRQFKKFFKFISDDLKEEASKPYDYAEHINVRAFKVWKTVFESLGLKIEKVKRHGILYGGYKHNRRRLLFAAVIVCDWILDCLPFMQNFTEGITFRLKKSFAYPKKNLNERDVKYET